MRLAIIGCGIAVRDLHLPAIKELTKEYTVTALLSRTAASALRVANHIKEFQDKAPLVYENLEQLLEEKPFDAVLLSLPTEHNISYVETLLQRGIPIICEKPIALDVAQGEAVLRLVEQYGDLLYIAENYRHMPELHRAKEIIESGVIGDPKVMTWSQWGCINPEQGYGATKWRMNPKHIGGYLSDGGVHHVAAMRLLMGDISYIQGVGFQNMKHTGAVDTYSATLAFNSGAIGTYSGSYALTGGANLCMVRGTKGYLIVTKEGIEVYTGIDGTEQSHIDITPSMGYYEEFLDFYHFCNGTNSGLGSPQEALEDLRVIQHMVESMKRAESKKE